MGLSVNNWIKSTFSGGDGCVEIFWKKSTKSSASGCVEVREDEGQILVRDTKLGEASPILGFTPHEWEAFIAGVKNGEFDL